MESNMHLVETMAYAGEKPWHGLGRNLPANESIDVWKKSAGMDWIIQESEVRYITGQNGRLSQPPPTPPLAMWFT